MATNLASLQARVATLLVDAAGVNFPAAQLEESLRLALGEYNLRLGPQGQAPVTLDGLDGATGTTLPVQHESMLVVGAAAYAVTGRTVSRAENYDLNQSLPQQLLDWALERLNDFRKMIDGIIRDAELARKSELHNAANPPWPTATTADNTSAWKLDEHDGEEL